MPRVYEKIHADVARRDRARERREARDRPLGAARRRAREPAAPRRARPCRRCCALQQRLADTLVFSKVRERLGGRLRLGVSGAAPLGIDVLEFFHSLDMLVIEGYGLTETSSSLSVNDPDDYRFGTVGHAVDGCERAARRRTARSSSAATRSSPATTRIRRRPRRRSRTTAGSARATSARSTRTASLKITDRKKDLIITAGGKNIAPQNLENALKASRFVSQALVVGDRRPYVDGADHARLARDADRAGRDPQELVQEIVDEVNRDRVRVEQIKRFTILPRDFSQEDGEVTPTLKLRRKVVHEHFADEIEAALRA